MRIYVSGHIDQDGYAEADTTRLYRGVKFIVNCLILTTSVTKRNNEHKDWNLAKGELNCTITYHLELKSITENICVRYR